MAVTKITEKTVASALKDGAHFLVTQPETVDGSPTEALRRVPISMVREDLEGQMEETYAKKTVTDELTEDVSELKSAINVLEPTATSSDIGKALIAKTISGGKVTAYEFGSAGGLSDEVKEALLDCFKNVAWITGSGSEYYDALEEALYPPPVLVSITCVFAPEWDIYTSDTLDLLKNWLVVTAHYENGTSEEVDDYTLTGTLTAGTSIIQISYENITTTFNVTVKNASVIDYTEDALDGLEWMDNKTYNQSTGELQTTSGEHCTEKFTVQDVVYAFISSETATSYVALFAWDENDNYLGYQQSSSGFNTRWQLDPNYTYAVKCYQPNTFDHTDITMIPVNNTEYQTPRFSIVLSDYTNDMQAVAGKIRVELDVTDIFAEYGIEPTSYIHQNIKRMSLPGNSNGIGISFDRLFNFRINLMYWQSKLILQMEKQGATTTSDIIDYIENQNVILDFNY